MSSALVGSHICVYVKPTDTRLSLLIGADDDHGRTIAGSALQNPELRRYELDCLLRRYERRPATPQPSGWQSLFSMARQGCANSNADSV